MGLIDKIKEESKKSGQSKGKFLYFKKDEKVRVRFLDDMEEGFEVPFHDSFEEGINVPCQELFGRSCEYCEQEGLRSRSLYAWSVYDYESKEVKILMQAVNNCTAVPALLALYETYGTMLDRDFVITKTGEKQNTAYSVVPMDKNKFKNQKAKPFSKKAILKNLDAAYPANDTDDEDEDDEDSKPRKPKMKDSDTKKKSKKDDYEDDYDDEEDDEEESENYEDMSAKELYQLCKKRKIDCLPKKPEKYYVKKLEQFDAAKKDWADDEDDNEEDDWD